MHEYGLPPPMNKRNEGSSKILIEQKSENMEYAYLFGQEPDEA